MVMQQAPTDTYNSIVDIRLVMVPTVAVRHVQMVHVDESLHDDALSIE